MTQTGEPKKKRSVLGWSWAGFDLLLVFGALIVGFFIWFIPSFWDTPELRAFYTHQKELKAKRLAIEAEEARIQKENDDLGIIYLPPPPKASATPAPKSGAQPAQKKPAQKKKDN